MQKINNQVVELVREEIHQQCESLQLAVRDSQELLESTETILESLHQLRGVAMMIDLPGSRLLLDELIGVLEDQELTIKEASKINAAIVILCNYLPFTLNRGEDNALLVLPEINSLRAAAKKSALNESQLMERFLPENNLVDTVGEYTDQSRLIVRSARHMFQQGLLHTIKGSSKAGSIRILGHAVRRIQQISPTEQEAGYWLLILQLLDAFAKRRLRLDKDRIRTLMSVERQMRQLMLPMVTVEAAYPQLLQKQALALYILAALDSPQAQNLREKLHLPKLNFNDESVASDRALFGSEGVQSFAETLSVIKDELDALSLFMERIEKGDQLDETDNENIFRSLLTVSEVCNVNGFSTAGHHFMEHAEELQKLEGSLNLDSPLVKNLVDSILYLECLLLEVNNRMPSEQDLKRLNGLTFQQLLESNVARHAQSVVLDESKNKLVEVIAKINDVQEGHSDAGLSRELAEAFTMVAGATSVVGLQKAAEIARRCCELLGGDQLYRLLEDTDSLSILADAIVSLEYYLDNCRWNTEFDPAVLTVAEESLDALQALQQQ